MLNEGVIHHGPVLSIGELLRFSDLIKGVPGLSKVVIITDTVYYSEKIQTEISNGKRHLWLGPGETRCGAYTCPLPVELHRWHLFLSPSNSVWVTYAWNESRKLTWALFLFLFLFIIESWPHRPGWPPLWLVLAFSPSRILANSRWTKASILNYIITLD